METVNLRYFIAVAKKENIHRAAEELSISPGSLSKAIQRLEAELRVKLFRREGRNIRLTEQGQFLLRKGTELMNLEASIRLQVLGQEDGFRVSIGGAEVLLSHFGVDLASTLRKSFPRASFEFVPDPEKRLFSKIRDGELDLGLTTNDPPDEFDSKTIEAVTFSTFISPLHPLSKKVRRGESVHIDELLSYPFVVPKSDLLGQISRSDSSDGWRDDKFPRKIDFVTSSLSSLLTLVRRGEALAYLPDYLGIESGLQKVTLDGCAYQCRQKVRLITRNKSEHGWQSVLF